MRVEKIFNFQSCEDGNFPYSMRVEKIFNFQACEDGNYFFHLDEFIEFGS
jgi:hypothetical protein